MSEEEIELEDQALALAAGGASKTPPPTSSSSPSIPFYVDPTNSAIISIHSPTPPLV